MLCGRGNMLCYCYLLDPKSYASREYHRWRDTMKILGVKFKNLSAMHGEWEIRFDQPPLVDTGLFAIVGPNGSGKTTIMDALSLALYGETPRLKNPESGIINWQSNDSYSEVTFSVDNHVYRSKWSARKVAGRPDPPEMCLADCNGTDTVLADRVIRVRERASSLRSFFNPSRAD